MFIFVYIKRILSGTFKILDKGGILMRKKNLVMKAAMFLLALAPVTVAPASTFWLWGEPELPQKMKKM